MIYLQFITNAPLYVWFVLAGLIVLGLIYSRDQHLRPFRVAVLPIAMTAYSLYGLLADFGLSLLTGGAWIFGAAASFAVGVRAGLAQDSEYDTQTGHFTVKGSWLPFAVMMIIFVNKYIIGVMKFLALPIMAESWFKIIICSLYGGYSGFFSSRGWVILRKRSG